MTSIILFKTSDDYEKYLKLSLEFYENKKLLEKYFDLKYTINFYCPYYQNLQKLNHKVQDELNNLIKEHYPVTKMEWYGSQKNQRYGPDYSYHYSVFHLQKFIFKGNSDNRLSRITESEKSVSQINLDTIKSIIKECENYDPLTKKEKDEFEETKKILQEFTDKIENGYKIYFFEQTFKFLDD